jgi:hypothetical protein
MTQTKRKKKPEKSSMPRKNNWIYRLGLESTPVAV